MMTKRAILWFLLSVLFLSALILLAMGAIAVAGMQNDTASADVAIILGNRIETDGQPSMRLRARLERALRLYETGRVPHIIVSGGMGLEGFDEATVMGNWLIAHGVPDAAITRDHAGVNTWATAKNAVPVMRTHGMESAYVVSQYFHVPRAKLALRRFGVDAVYGASPDFFEWRDIYSTFREVVAYMVYAWRRLPEPSDSATLRNLFRSQSGRYTA